MRTFLKALALFCCLVTGVFAQVKASLVLGDTHIQPGSEARVILKLVHDEHWHTYWKNPGTGLPTEIKWEVPEGWSVSDIEWPVPSAIHGTDGEIVGNGYEGVLLLPVRIKAPAAAQPGVRISLKARVSWLMCRESCVPGSAKLSIDLPVAKDPAAPTETGKAAAAQLFDRVDTARDLRAYAKDGKGMTLVAKGSAPKAEGLRFYCESEVIAFDAAQTLRITSGGWELDCPFVVDTAAAPERVKGVLAFVEANGLRVGLSVDTPVRPWGELEKARSQVKSSAAAVGNGPSPTPGLLGTLLAAFVGGLILNLMPCVFPVLGIKILGFVNQAGSERAKVVAHGLIFTLGVLLSFWALAGLLAALHAGGSKLGWGFQLQFPPFVFVLSVVMLVFAMNMSGVFEFGLRATSVGAELQMKSGYSGSFFTGVLATVVATPCSAPFLAPALGAAVTLPLVESFLVFTSIALGLSMPYLSLSIFPKAVKLLPRPGAWMETFKQFMAFPLYATVGYMAWVLAGQTGDEGFFNVLMGLVLVALAVWIYGRWTAPGRKDGVRKVAMLLATLVGALGLWLGWPQKEASAAQIAAAQAAGQAPAVTWEKWSPETLAKYRSEGRIVYVDFTARWCATCQANKKLVFHSEEVLREFAARKVVTLRGDWTNSDPAITEELARWGRSAVPFNQVYLPGKDQPLLLPELLTPQIVLDALKP